MQVLKRIKKILPVFAAVIAAPAVSFASVSMTLPQYINEILLNNHTLKAAIKNVEASYYSVLASVAYQRPKTNLDCSVKRRRERISPGNRQFKIFSHTTNRHKRKL